MLNNDLAVLIVAAGNSSRLGQPKQLIPWKNTNLLGYTFECAKELSDRLIVVLGANFQLLQSTIDSRTVVEFKDWERGMGASIGFGMTQVLSRYPDVESVLITVCDQPYITSDHLKELVAVHNHSNRPVSASAYDNTLGVPAIFSKEIFSELLLLDGYKGARSIIDKYLTKANAVTFHKGQIDIDTPQDLDRLSN